MATCTKTMLRPGHVRGNKLCAWQAKAVAERDAAAAVKGKGRGKGKGGNAQAGKADKEAKIKSPEDQKTQSPGKAAADAAPAKDARGKKKVDLLVCHSRIFYRYGCMSHVVYR